MLSLPKHLAEGVFLVRATRRQHYTVQLKNVPPKKPTMHAALVLTPMVQLL
jgi:hypothetical protein